MKKNRKEKQISIRVTEDELKRIQAAATREFDYPSSWMRKKILGAIENA